jgi:1,4-dihydroxy-2-naphthoate octaprenyltransferase
VVLGDARTRAFYVALMGVGAVTLVAVAAVTSWWALLGLVALVPGLRAVRLVTAGTTGRGLIPVLALTGSTELVYSLGLFAGLLVAGR